MDNIIELNDVNFDQEVKRSTVPVLVDFYADWCGHCVKQLPVIDELSKDVQGKVRIGKLNVDNGPKVSNEYSISSIPALLIFNNNKMAERLTGFHSKKELLSILSKYF